MDKTFIMSLDDNSDLLGKEPHLQGMVNHPIAFPSITAVLVKRSNASQIVKEHFEKYQDRTFFVTPDNYGVEVSVNYVDGKFKSMILKGNGEQGERIHEAIATSVMPKESISKSNITLHALLTIWDLKEFRGGISKLDVDRVVKSALLNGFVPYEDKKIVCRALRLYIDDKITYKDGVWDVLSKTVVLTGVSFECNYEQLNKYVEETVKNENETYLPQRGFIVGDYHPEDEKAIPETHFIFDGETVFENP